MVVVCVAPCGIRLLVILITPVIVTVTTAKGQQVGLILWGYS